MLYNHGLYPASIIEFNSVLDLTDEDSEQYKLALFYIGEAYSTLGLNHLRLNRLDLAEDELKQALLIHPNYADIHYHLALTYYKRKDYEKAEGHFSSALEINPSFARALIYCGLAEIRQGKLHGMEKIVRAAGKEPGLSCVRYQHALKLYCEGRIDEFIVEMEEVAEKDMDQIGKLIEKSHCLMKQRLYRDAARILLETLNTCPNYADLRNSLGLCYLRQGMIDLAVGQISKAIEINPKYLAAHISLSLAYEKSGRRELAVAELKLVLELDPGNATAARFMSMLEHRQ